MAQYNSANTTFQTFNKTLFEVNMIANGNNGLVVSNTNPFPVTTTGSGFGGSIKVDGINPDAFGRARVSEPFTLGDYKHLFSIDPNFNDRLVGNGSVVYTQNKACATLITTANTSDAVTHQTKFYHHYQPGKSQLILSSVCFGYPQRNITKRTGYFDDRDGIYFEQVGGDTANGSTSNTSNHTLNWVIRSYTSNTASESSVGTYKRRVPQSEWNVDKCDGTGASGFNLDLSKTQIAYIDFQWLGVGRVRCGFVHNGQVIVAHEYFHSNVLSEVYISNPNLPVRCEIRNTGTTPGGSMDQICSSVSSEGGYVESGIDFAITSGARTTATPSATPLPLIAIRLKNQFNGFPNRITVRLNNVSFFAETNSAQYDIVKLPSANYLSGAGPLVWTSADSSSGVEYCVNATAYQANYSTILSSGFLPAGSSQNSLSPVATGDITTAKKNVILQNFDSTDSEVYVVVVRTITTVGNQSTTVGAALQWREIY